MQIGIVLDNYESPMEDLENIISSYGLMREVGYLRINPERVPVVMSESKADEAIDRFQYHIAEYDICDGKYELVADDRGIATVDDSIIISGNAFIARRQGRALTGLTASEITDWLKRLEKMPRNKVRSSRDNTVFSGYVFTLDKEKGCWN